MSDKPKNTLAEIHAEIDHEPAAGKVLARVIRLERVLEKMAGKDLDSLLSEEKEKAPEADQEAGQEESKEAGQEKARKKKE